MDAASNVVSPAAVRPLASATSRWVDRKTRLKFLLRRWIGEPYVGKRMKLRHLNRLLRSLDLPPSPSFLEMGSGDGVFCDWLARRWPYSLVDGIDQNAIEVEACQRWAHEAGLSHRVHFKQGDILDLTETATRDLVICLDVLEYVRDAEKAIANLARALKPRGWLVIHGPNVTYQRLDGSFHYVPPDQAWRIDPRHVRHGYSPDELRTLLDHAGLEVVDVRMLHGRITDLAFNVYRTLEEPSPLRLLSLPIVDVLSWLDRQIPAKHGNTVFGLARQRA